MAEIRPFRAIRYNGDAVGLADVTAPPYDVVSLRQREELLSRSPFNVVRLELPEGEGDRRYENAAETYSRWLSDGILVRDEEPSIYPCYQDFEFEGRRFTRKGFIANVRVEDFGKKIVLPHERTFSKHKEDRLKLTLACNSNLSQVFCVYPDASGDVERIVDETRGEPIAEIDSDDGTRNTLWKTSDPETILGVRSLLKDSSLLIADGHHRYETSVNFRNIRRKEAGAGSGPMPWDYVAMYLSRGESEGLIINPTHRMVKDAGENLLKKLEKNFEVEKTTPERSLDLRSNQISVVTRDPGTVFRLTPRKRREKNHENLAVIILHDLAFDELPGGKETKAWYSKFPEEVFEKVRGGEFHAGFLLPKLRSEDIFEVVLEGNKMPHKTTYFYPKILSGLVFNSLR